MWEYVNEAGEQIVHTDSTILHEAVICEQILSESITDAYIVEGDELLEGLDLYINQLENDNINEELEEALSELIEPYFEMTLPLYEASISKSAFDAGITKAQDYARSANKKGVRSGKSLKQIEGDKASSSAGPGETVNPADHTKGKVLLKRAKRKVGSLVGSGKKLLAKMRDRFGKSKLAGMLSKAKSNIASKVGNINAKMGKLYKATTAGIGSKLAASKLAGKLSSAKEKVANKISSVKSKASTVKKNFKENLRKEGIKQYQKGNKKVGQFIYNRSK